MERSLFRHATLPNKNFAVITVGIGTITRSGTIMYQSTSVQSVEIQWNNERAVQDGGADFAATNVGAHITIRRFWISGAAGQIPNRCAPIAGKNFSRNGGQGANGNSAVMHVGLSGRRSTEKQIRQKNRRPGNLRFVERP